MYRGEKMASLYKVIFPLNVYPEIQMSLKKDSNEFLVRSATVKIT